MTGHTESWSEVGINYGTIGNNLPSPHESIKHIRSMKASRVKLYDCNPEILKALSGTRIQVSIMVRNDEISSIASSQTIADQWVEANVLAYYPKTLIRIILVGNEVLSYNDQKMWCDLVPAMRKIHHSLIAHNITNIKVGTPFAMDIMHSTFPPSSGTFRPDITATVMLPLLKFLKGTHSFFFIDVYPYFPWSADPNNIHIDQALLKETFHYTDHVNGLIYTNLLDQMLDSLIFAMTKLGYPDIRLSIAETGWPTAGDANQHGANVHFAATYNQNLVKKIAAKPAIGTPARPGMVIPTFIFALYNENQKSGPGTERNWGLLHADGTPVYNIDLSGKQAAFSSNFVLPVPVGNHNVTHRHRGEAWCVAKAEVDLNALHSALSFACGLCETCGALAPGRECHVPGSNSLTLHASFAFSSYFAKFHNLGATCDFNGLATLTTNNPSEFFQLELYFPIPHYIKFV